MDSVFKALSDPGRRKILSILKKGDMPAGEIANRAGMSPPLASHHLEALRKAGLVIAERKGQFIEYSLNQSVFEELVESVMKYITKNK